MIHLYERRHRFTWFLTGVEGQVCLVMSKLKRRSLPGSYLASTPSQNAAFFLFAHTIREADANYSSVATPSTAIPGQRCLDQRSPKILHDEFIAQV